MALVNTFTIWSNLIAINHSTWLASAKHLGTTRSKWFQSNTCQRNKINDLIIGKLSGSGLSINPLVHITNSQSLIRIEKLKVKLICKMHHIKSPKSLDFESHFQHLPRICMLGYIWNNCHVAATHFFICILKAPDVVGVGQYPLYHKVPSETSTYYNYLNLFLAAKLVIN